MMNFGFGNIFGSAIGNVPQFITEFFNYWFMGGFLNYAKNLFENNAPAILRNFLNLAGPSTNNLAAGTAANDATADAVAGKTTIGILKSQIFPLTWKFFLVQALLIFLIWLIYRHYVNKKRREGKSISIGSIFKSILKVLCFVAIFTLFITFIISQEAHFFLFEFIGLSLVLELFIFVTKSLYASIKKLSRRGNQSIAAGKPVHRFFGLIAWILGFAVTLALFIVLIPSPELQIWLTEKYESIFPDPSIGKQTVLAVIFGWTLILKLFVYVIKRLYINLSSLTRRIVVCIADYDSRLKFIWKAPVLVLRIFCLLLSQELFILFFAFILLIHKFVFFKIFCFMLIFEFSLLLLKYMFPNLIWHIRFKGRSVVAQSRDDDELYETTEEYPEQDETEDDIEKAEIDDSEDQTGHSDNRSQKMGFFKRLKTVFRGRASSDEAEEGIEEDETEETVEQDETEEDAEQAETEAVVEHVTINDSEDQTGDSDNRSQKMSFFKRLKTVFRERASSEKTEEAVEQYETEVDTEQAEREPVVEHAKGDDSKDQTGDSGSRSQKKSLHGFTTERINYTGKDLAATVNELNRTLNELNRLATDPRRRASSEERKVVVEHATSDDSKGQIDDPDDRYLKKILVKRLINLLRQVSIQRQIGAAASRNDDEISETTKGLIKRLTNLFRSGKQK